MLLPLLLFLPHPPLILLQSVLPPILSLLLLPLPWGRGAVHWDRHRGSVGVEVPGLLGEPISGTLDRA